jgi:HEAT repeat protein
MAHSSVILILASLGLLASATAQAEALSSGLSDGERAQCVEILKSALKEDSLSFRVHAAEALIALHQPEPVLKAFDSIRDTTEPKDRILVWRVLARAEPDRARGRDYVDKIRAVLLEPKATDQTHAMEALAKLDEAPASEAEQKRVREVAESSGPEAPFALWRLANLHEASAIDRLAKLLRASDKVTRFRATYVLGRLRSENPEAGNALSAALAQPSIDATPILRAAASAIGSRDVIRDADALPTDRYFAAMFLADAGTHGDIALLKPLLSDSNSDVRIAAAYALLKLDSTPATTAPVRK